MAKKKKAKATTPIVAVEQGQPHNVDGCSSDAGINVVDVVRVRLTATAGKSSSLCMQPRVIMTSSDATQLNACIGDYIILIETFAILNADDNAVHPNGIKTVAILPLEIYHEKQTLGGTPSSVLRKNVSRQFTKGTIQITSDWVLDRFLLHSGNETTASEEEKSGSVPATPLRLPNPSTPGSFSFKSFVHTPSPTKERTSTPKSRVPSPNTNNNVPWVDIISARSILGRRMIQSLCSTCTRLVVEPIVAASATENKPDDPKDLLTTPALSSSSVRVLERLIQSHVVGSYVQLNQVLRISFTGKPYSVRIVDAVVDDGTANGKDGQGNFECQFSQLRISDNSDISQCSKEGQSIATAVEKCQIRLFAIHRSTIISIRQQNESEDTVALADGKEGPAIHKGPHVEPTQYVAGLSSTLEEVRSLLLLPLARPDLFENRGMKPPKGILLHGPSGVGKTSLARQLASEIKMNTSCSVQFVNCASFQSKAVIVGEAEASLTQLFRGVSNDNKKIPTLLILDDVHLICPRRGGTNSPGMDRLAATLLALMDGIHSSGNNSMEGNSGTLHPRAKTIVILATTTNPSLLDSAIRRPGRLDAEVEVPIPEELTTRAEILQFHITRFGVPLSDSSKMTKSDWSDLAKLAKGFNGADCMLAVKEAIRLAIFDVEVKSTPIDGQTPTLKLRTDHLRTAIRSIKPSAIKSISIEIPQVHWSSIGGMDSVKRELREAIELPLTHSAYFERLRVPPPRGILLYGPPGCSKTLMARALATEGSMNFLAVKGPELLSKWLGESERALASLFRRARMASPAIIFFDEIDAIASKRGSGDSASSSRLLSQLLTELDGVAHSGSTTFFGKNSPKPQNRVVVVGATNRPDLLDTALTRPGRIDRMIYVGVPDSASRAQILHLTLREKGCGTDLDIEALASDEYSAGFSGAEIVAICRDAALLALEESDSRMTSTTDNDDDDTMPLIEMRHMVLAMKGMQRQITPAMLDFYATYRESTRTAL